MIEFLKGIFSRSKYVIHRSEKNDNFYFSLIAKNGETILTSEGYQTKEGALNGISSVSVNGKYRDSFEIKKSKDNKHYFILKANNNKVIGTSEMYNHLDSATNGIESVMSCCESSSIKFDI
jgi:uncharacterized protein YegP (UPF0339 family)